MTLPVLQHLQHRAPIDPVSARMSTSTAESPFFPRMSFASSMATYVPPPAVDARMIKN